jgi:hypothetical protein
VKSQKRLDEEIDALERVWELRGTNDPYDRENSIAAELLNALQWVRGRKTTAPAEALADIFAKRDRGTAA